MNDGAAWPLEHWLEVEELAPTGRDFALVPDADARQRLGAALDLLDLPDLRVRGRVWPSADGVFVEFGLVARVVQRCVVTLDPVTSDIDEQVRLHYTPRAALHQDTETIEFTEDDDLPEPLVDGRVDLGAAVCEHLALALDPWPRRPDAEMPAAATSDETPNPFAVLERLKRNDE